MSMRDYLFLSFWQSQGFPSLKEKGKLMKLMNQSLGVGLLTNRSDNFCKMDKKTTISESLFK